MPTMTYDWLTAAVLEPFLRRGGHGLGHLAGALYAATSACTQEDVAMQDGRRALMSEFTTDRSRRGMPFVQLMASGWNPFASPSESKPLVGLPPMWGAIAHVGSDYVLKPAGIRLHDDLVVLPSSGGGMVLFRGAIAETIATAMVGQPFARVVEHEALAPLDLVVRRLRPAAEAERHAFNAGHDTRSGGDDATKINVATFRNDKTPRRFEIPL